MFKKCISFVMIFFTVMTLASCKNSDEQNTEEKKDWWAGSYVMINEETGEFKILTVSAETETENDVVLSFESVRDKDEFTGVLKTKSKKYAVCNAGDRCLKFNLKSSATVIAVDDMWTNPETERKENWTGKYVLLEEGVVPEKFGDSSWNGKYTCKDNGLTVETYGIKEGLVLLTYRLPETNEKLNFKCLVTPESKREVLYTDESRTIKIKLMRSNKSIVITDTPANPEQTTISGRYAI